MRVLTLSQTTEAKDHTINFIEHRLDYRYLEPLRHVPCDRKSGFLIMAAGCLMIEALQCFYEGIQATDRGDGGPMFKRFFDRNLEFFPGFSDNSIDFYGNIRCGILHQAQTQGAFRIWQHGPILDIEERTINASEFILALEATIKKYVPELRGSTPTCPVWLNAIEKIGFICGACSSEATPRRKGTQKKGWP